MTSASAKPTIAIMGIRGVPARHGGFETFAARLAPYLVEQGWDTTVYCHEDADCAPFESVWHGVRRVHIGVGPDTAVNSIRFDWACVKHAAQHRPDVVLTLGYNTAAFGFRLHLAGVPNVINMDGMEWQRKKWGAMARLWLYINDRAACWFGMHLIADHPEIERYLHTRADARKVSMIPYGAEIHDPSDRAALAPLGLQHGAYATLIARPEPENSVLQIVQAFSARRRGVRLVVLGHFVPDKVRYHADVRAAASDEVVFAGAIYDVAVMRALRHHSAFYLHGHRVGGTNPSLLEAMGAGNAVIAHDNRYNRWVADGGALYFKTVDGCAAAIDRLLGDPAECGRLGAVNRERAVGRFAWSQVMAEYEALLAATRRSGLPLLVPAA